MFISEEAHKKTATFLVSSATNETLSEVSEGKMWFSTMRQSLGNRISASSVWLLMYVMGYVVKVWHFCGLPLTLNQAFVTVRHCNPLLRKCSSSLPGTPLDQAMLPATTTFNIYAAVE